MRIAKSNDIRRYLNGGPYNPTGTKKPAEAVANPRLAPNYLTSLNFDQIARIVDAQDRGESVMYDPALSSLVAQFREDFTPQTQSMYANMDGYQTPMTSGAVSSVSPMQYVSPVGDAMDIARGLNEAFSGVKEGDLGKVGMGSGLTLGAIGMAFLPGTLGGVRAAADVGETSRALHHIADAIEDSQRAGTDLTPSEVFGQLERANYSPDELADAADRIDQLVEMSRNPGYQFNMNPDEANNLLDLQRTIDNYLEMGENIDGVIDPTMVSRSYNEVFDQAPTSVQDMIADIEEQVDNALNPQDFSDIRSTGIAQLENYYGQGQVPEELLRGMGIHPTQTFSRLDGIDAEMPAGISQNTPTAGQAPIQFRGVESNLPPTVGSFKLQDYAGESSRSMSYRSPSGDEISMDIRPLEEKWYTFNGGTELEQAVKEAYPDSYMAKIGYADVRQGRRTHNAIQAYKKELEELKAQGATEDQIRMIEQKLGRLEAMPSTSQKDVHAMMTALFDEIQTGDLVDPGSLSPDSYGMWLRQIDKGNKYLTQGGKKQGARLIPESKLPRESTISYSPLNSMGEFSNTFKIPEKYLDDVKEYDLLTGKGTDDVGLYMKYQREGKTQKDINDMMYELKENYIDPALEKRGLPPSKLEETYLQRDGVKGLVFEFPLPFLEKLRLGGKIKLKKMNKGGMRCKKR